MESEMSRVPVLAPEQMNEAQRKVYEDILRTRGGKWFHGPYDPMLHQPRIAQPAQQLGEFVRYHTSVHPKLVELAILVVARHWDCEVEWHQHAGIAASSGLSAALIEALRRGEYPHDMDAEEVIVFEFTHALLKEHRIADAYYEKAKQRLGVVGVVELTGLIGYYTFIAFALNAHEVSLPEGVSSPFG
jgi:4-carboxymuconolactone decarboxylase